MSGSTRSGPALLAAALSWFLLLAMAVSYPLILNLGTHVPGADAGDNIAFLWNFWWFRYALEQADATLFFTGHLFAPFGTSLVLHTHTALPALAGATLLSRAPVVQAHNLVLLAGLAANGLCAGALAFHDTRRLLPAVLAGTIFAASAWVSIRLLGHFNLVHAWVIPLALLAWICCTEAPSVGRSTAVAGAFAAAAYTDYYFLAFAAIACAVFSASSRWQIATRWGRPRSNVSARVAVVLMIATGALMLIVLATGGIRFSIGSTRISMTGLRNPVAALWLLTIVWTALHIRLTVTRTPDARPLKRIAPATVAALTLFAVAVLPLAIPAIGLLVTGDYVSPPFVWRSGPRGIDLLTLVAGNPLNPAYGHVTRAAYARVGIDVMEQSAWIGIVPLIVLGIFAATAKERDAAARPWWSVALFFLIWATGAYLLVGGLDTGLPMPQTLARFVPILSNARIPGRAIIMVQLAAAILCARAVTRLQWRPGAVLVLIALGVADGSGAPIRLYEVPAPGAIESVLVGAPRREAIVELPMGLRDGFGEAGHMDHRALVFQMAHQKPLAGGFVARLSPKVRAAYEQTPALVALIKLSSGSPSHSSENLPADLGSGLLSAGVRHVVVNTDSMPRDLRAALESRGFKLVAVEGRRELYRVSGK